jgi:hypothetical protein
MMPPVYRDQPKQEQNASNQNREEDDCGLGLSIHVPALEARCGYVKYNIARQVGNALGMSNPPSR